MIGPVSLRYYEGVFRLLGRAPRLSAGSLRRIERWEAERGARLPAAVREWYALKGAGELMAECLPGNRQRPLAKFLASFAGPAAGQGTEDLPGVVFFEPWTANTGIVAYLRPDGTDDPPISLSLEEGEMLFSAFIADVAWEAVTLGRSHIFAAGNSAQDYPAEFGPPQIDFLTEEFDGVMRGGERRPFRFFRAGPGWQSTTGATRRKAPAPQSTSCGRIPRSACSTCTSRSGPATACRPVCMRVTRASAGSWWPASARAFQELKSPNDMA
jgi:hypothetical protein